MNGCPVVNTERLSPDHFEAVANLFAAFAADPTASRFHPHEFSAAEALKIANHTGLDIYLGMWVDGALQGYGMLRGFDAGFAVPSLGIYVCPPARGTGHARALMLALHDAARAAGAHQVRLKVYPDNTRAIGLYESLGYRFVAEEAGQRVGLIDLQAGPN